MRDEIIYARRRKLRETAADEQMASAMNSASKARTVSVKLAQTSAETSDSTCQAPSTKNGPILESQNLSLPLVHISSCSTLLAARFLIFLLNSTIDCQTDLSLQRDPSRDFTLRAPLHCSTQFGAKSVKRSASGAVGGVFRCTCFSVCNSVKCNQHYFVARQVYAYKQLLVLDTMHSDCRHKWFLLLLCIRLHCFFCCFIASESCVLCACLNCSHGKSVTTSKSTK